MDKIEATPTAVSHAVNRCHMLRAPTKNFTMLTVFNPKTAAACVVQTDGWTFMPRTLNTTEKPHTRILMDSGVDGIEQETSRRGLDA